ncbi:MAG: (Fe-S)-binding protein [Candidatus Heimdallarchaeota archaeon]
MVKIAYYPGCTTKKFRPEMIEAAMQVFSTVNIDVINASDAVCCGYPLQEAGEEESARTMARKALEELNEFNTIVTPCPTCTMMLRQFEPEKVKHMSEYLTELLRANRSFKQGRLEVNFHDPCHLGRGARVYEAPRDVLKRLPGVTLIEVPHNREASLCCGGPAIHLFPDMATVMAEDVLKEMNAPVLITACPTCKSSLLRKNKQVYDIAELVITRID